MLRCRGREGLSMRTAIASVPNIISGGASTRTRRCRVPATKAGDYVPAEMVAVVRPWLCEMLNRAIALHTLIHRPAPSYAIMRRVCPPTAERTLDPARMFDEERTPRVTYSSPWNAVVLPTFAVIGPGSSRAERL